MKTEVFLYNSLTKKKELFLPLDPKNVRIYVCGPTVYDRVHLGNARPLVVFDVLTRLLRLRFGKVTYVRNITDVDDKILERAQELGITIQELTTRTLQQFHEDSAALGVYAPDVEPKATEHIAAMIAMIETLLQKNKAYEAQGHVLFDVGAFPDYGALSKRNVEDMRAGARVEVAPYKKSPFDFVLWKPSEDGQPGWESPFGWGRPGWHIECSAMSYCYLGKVFDIHGGGNDLLFPHHENERAQTCAAFQEPEMARYWVHNGMLLIDGQKMSKSLGNFITLRQALDRYSGDWVRVALLSTHYRSALDWTPSLLEQSRLTLDKVYQLISESDPVISDDPDAAFLEAVCDDLNTPLALSRLQEKTQQGLKAGGEEKNVCAGQVVKMCQVLGLLQHTPQEWFRPLHKVALSEKEIDAYIDQRNEARAQKNYAQADHIRDLLAVHHISLQDIGSQTVWRFSPSASFYQSCDEGGSSRESL